jgi:hypothetical protein
MAKYVLNTAAIEEDFFSGSRLLAIGCPLPGYQLCWWLNQLFALQFKRDLELDIYVARSKGNMNNAGTLFQETERFSEESYYFPVYRHDLSYFDASLFLYGNRAGAKRLLPEWKHADFLLLIQYADFWDQENHRQPDFTKNPQISWIREVDLDLLKSKRNLIV